MRRAAVVAALGAALATSGAASGSHAPPGEILRLGAGVYAEHCAACHGADLEGQPDWRRPSPDGTLPAPPHDETGHTWHHSDRLLTDYVTLGGAETMRRLGVAGFASGMPAFGEILSPAEIEAVLDYIASHWSDRARDFQREITRQEADAGR